MTFHQALGEVDEALDEALATVSAHGDRQMAVRQLQRARRELRRARELAEPPEAAPDGSKSATHELRGLLGAIAGWAQLLQINGRDPATVVRAGEAIERNAKALAAELAQLTGRADRRGGRARDRSA